MRLSFKLLIVALVIGLIFTAFVLWSFNFLSDFLILVLGFVGSLVVGIGVRILGEGLINRYNLGSVKADSVELQREDDVLLQTVTFSSAILLFLVNLVLVSETEKIAFTAFVVIFAIPFYGLRAYGKVKDSPKYRYYSMVFLGFLVSDYIFAFTAGILQYTLKPSGMLSISLNVAVAGATVSVGHDFVRKIFKTRYGYE